MSEHEEFEIECPQCGENNTIPRPNGWECQHCKAPIGSGRYKKKLISAWAAAFLGAGGMLGTTYLIDDNRYSVGTEHAIIEVCINASVRPLPRKQFLAKKKTCVCALEQTQEDFDQGQYQEEAIQFMKAFEKNVRDCS